MEHTEVLLNLLEYGARVTVVLIVIVVLLVIGEKRNQ